VVFECAVVIGFSWLMWQGNKIRIKYVVISLCAMFVPNLMALPRFGGTLDWQTKIAGIFSFEYTVLTNNIVSSAIANNPPLLVDFFISISSLLIPSPLRNVLGTGITGGVAPDYFEFILEDAGAFGGGYRSYLHNILPRLDVHSEVEKVLCVSPRRLHVRDWLGDIPNVSFLGCKPLSLLRCNLEHDLRGHLERFSPDVLFLPTERYFEIRDYTYRQYGSKYGTICSQF